MLAEVFKSIEETFLKFNLRRFLFLAFCLLAFVLACYTYEVVTARAYFNKVNNQIAAIQALHAMDKDGVSSSGNLGRAYSNLVSSTQSIEIRPFKPRLPLYAVAKFTSATFIIWVVMLMSINDMLQGKPGWKDTFFGAIVCMIIFGLIGVAIPTIHATWVNPAAYLFMNFLVIAYFMKKGSS